MPRDKKAKIHEEKRGYIRIRTFYLYSFHILSAGKNPNCQNLLLKNLKEIENTIHGKMNGLLT